MILKNKIFSLLALCLSVSCASAFAACETPSDSSKDSSLEINSSNTDNSSSEEYSSFEENSSSEDPVPESQQMSEAEWQTALSAENFANCTINGLIVVDNTTVGTVLMKNDGTKLYQRSQEETTYEAYYSLEDETLYMYMDFSGSGNFTKVDASTLDPNYTPTFAELSMTSTLTAFIEAYEDFVYDAEANNYTMEADGEIVVLTFANNKLATCQHTLSGETAETTTLTFSDYGTTTVTLPTIEEHPDAVGDGIITENEFAAALNLSAFDNVKVSYTIPATEEASAITMTVWFDESTNVQVFGNFGDFTLTEWWTASGAFVYDATTSQWILSDYPIGYTAADNLLTSFSSFIPLYSVFLFDGYTATFTSTDPDTQAVTVIMLTFNEQEQLTGYYDGSMYWSFSDYGTVENVLPF